MLLNATAKTDSHPLPMVASTILQEMWGQLVLDIPPTSGTWRKQQSTTATAAEAGLSGTEGVISEPKNVAEAGVGQSEFPVPQ